MSDETVKVPIRCPYCHQFWSWQEFEIDHPWYKDMEGWPDVIFSALCPKHEGLDTEHFDVEEQS